MDGWFHLVSSGLRKRSCELEPHVFIQVEDFELSEAWNSC